MNIEFKKLVVYTIKVDASIFNDEFLKFEAAKGVPAWGNTILVDIPLAKNRENFIKECKEKCGIEFTSDRLFHCHLDNDKVLLTTYLN